MCIFAAEAQVAQTSIYAGETLHPVSQQLIHVILYKNNVENLGTGGNAMILPIPAGEPMGPSNFISTQKYPEVLDHLVEAARPQSRGGMTLRGMPAAKGMRSIQIFGVGSYQVVLAQHATASEIQAALQQVDAQKRPSLSTELLEFFTQQLRGYHLALCCFNNVQMQTTQPVMYWYVPNDPTQLVLPALDCHTGGAPDLNALVQVDHSLVVGSHRMKFGSFFMPEVRDPAMLPYLPTYVWGRDYRGWFANGDFVIPIEKVRDQSTWAPAFERVVPSAL